MKNVAHNLRPWLTGTAVAFAGVFLARIVAPQLEGQARFFATALGQLLALAGLFILCLGVRRRIRASTPK